MDVEVPIAAPRLEVTTVHHINTWTESNKRFLHEWGEEARVLSSAHDAAAKHYSKQHRWLTIPTLVLSASASGLTAYGLSNGPTAEVAGIGAFVCSFGAAVLGGINNFLEWNIRSQKHGNVSARYESVWRSIESLMQVPEERREDVETEILRARLEFKGISELAPLLGNKFIPSGEGADTAGEAPSPA